MHEKLCTVGCLLLSAVIAGGCTITFPAFVTADEYRADRAARLSVKELTHVAPGTRIRVERRDGARFKGRYVAVRTDQSRSPKATISGDTLVVEIDEREAELPVAQLERVKRVREQHSIWPAFVMGGVIDAAVLYGLSQTTIGVGLRF